MSAISTAHIDAAIERARQWKPTPTRRVERVISGLDRLGALRVATNICAAARIPLDEAMGEARWPDVVRVRHRIWTVLHDTLGLGWSEMRRLFEVDHTTIMAAVRKQHARLAAEHAE